MLHQVYEDINDHLWLNYNNNVFFYRYIYIPIYQTLTIYSRLPKLAVKVISSLFTFIFIFIWHGTTKQIFVWSLLNFLGIILETLGKNISETEKYKRFVVKYLKTDAMETRFKAMMCTPLLILSAVSNFYLFAGMDVGDLYFQCFVRPKVYGVFVICLPMYCCCQVSMALQDVPSRTDVKNVTVRHEISDKKTNVKTDSNRKKIDWSLHAILLLNYLFQVFKMKVKVQRYSMNINCQFNIQDRKKNWNKECIQLIKMSRL